MDERLKKTIVGASLFAFGTHTFDLAHEGIIGHEMPSAFIVPSTGVATSTASISVMVTPDFVMSFGSAVTEAVYPGVADSQVLKHARQVQLPSSKAGPKA
jgi:hypothetical protein